jgi:hypothetical protein
MTNAELLVLLREAQRYVASHDCNSRCNCIAAYDLQRLFERIKAALAERQDSAKDVVEWRKVGGGLASVEVSHIATIGDIKMEVYDLDAPIPVLWEIKSTFAKHGYAPTIEEAKSAAIAAARGMR